MRLTLVMKISGLGFHSHADDTRLLVVNKDGAPLEHGIGNGVC